MIHDGRSRKLPFDPAEAVEHLRASDAKTRPFRQMQVQAAVRFCDVLFGHDYASLMKKVADVAVSGERKSSQAG